MPKQPQKLRTLQAVAQARTLQARVPPGPWPDVAAAKSALELHFGLKMKEGQADSRAASRGTQQPLCCTKESRNGSNGCRFQVVIEQVEDGSETVWAPWRAKLTHTGCCSVVDVDEQVAGLLHSPNPDRERQDVVDAQKLQQIESQVEEMVQRRSREPGREAGAEAFRLHQLALNRATEAMKRDVCRGVSASRPSEPPEPSGSPSSGHVRPAAQPEVIDITDSPDALDGLTHHLSSLGLRAEPAPPQPPLAEPPWADAAPKPKPPRSGYDVFCRVQRAERPALRGLRVGQQSQELGASWKALAERERAPYNEQARKVIVMVMHHVQ